jgi:hypothetical protein
MPSLLNLPREIREQIIEYAILHKDVRAETLQDKQKRAEVHDGFNYFSKTQEIGIRWPRGYAKANISTSPFGLLLSNKLIREETLYIMSRQPSKNPELDILIVEEDELWPTWTYIPAVVANRPKTVNVTIRMLGITREEHSGFEEESNLVTLWRFSSILERLLRCTWKAPSSDDVDEKIKLECLILDFLTPSKPPGTPILPENVAAHWAQRERASVPAHENAYIHPYALAMSLANWVSVTRQYRSLDQEFMGSKHDLMNLLERISTMKFRVNGVDRHTELIRRTATPRG